MITVGTKVTVDSSVGSATGPGGIDFHHTATDEKAIQGSTPHLYMVWCDGSLAVNFAKYTYSGGTWTAGTTRVIYTGAATPTASMVFDGTRVLIALMDGINGGLFERDAADTTTTTRAGSGATLYLTTLTYDNDGNVWIAGVESTDLKVRKFIRSTLAWATDTCAFSISQSNIRSRASAVIALESFRPTGSRPGSSRTAAAVTGPASGPRPTSSTPTTKAAPAPSAAASRLKSATVIRPPGRGTSPPDPPPRPAQCRVR